MKNLLLATLILLGGYWFINTNPEMVKGLMGSGTSNEELQQAYKNRQTNIQVTGEGEVVDIYPWVRDQDNIEQKFVIQLSSGLRVLIIHNLQQSSPVSNLKEGDGIQFSGIYIWNSSGGIVQGTHQDPSGLRWPGWLKHRGTTYE